MSEEIQYPPNKENVQKVVSAIDTLLDGPEFADMPTLDVMIAVCGFGDYMKALMGVTALVAEEDAADVQD